MVFSKPEKPREYIIEIIKPDSDMENVPQLSLKGFSQAQIDVELGMIRLTAHCYRLDIETTPEQTDSIEKALKGEIDIRPNTHDLIKYVLESFDIGVLMVKIDDFIENIYRAKLILRQNDKILNLDVRPSDAVAIAVRTNASIYVKNSLLESKGEWVC